MAGVNNPRFCVIAVISSLEMTEDDVCLWEGRMPADHRKGKLVIM